MREEKSSGVKIAQQIIAAYKPESVSGKLFRYKSNAKTVRQIVDKCDRGGKFRISQGYQTWGFS